MAQSPTLNSEPAELNLREWGLKARMISRENTKSRRFSSSYITSFREDSKSFTSNINISSTASSPGYNLREEIDPLTYSFSSALRALQARSVNTWGEGLSPEGFALNSKWNEAEKYICNPVSGEVPMECLSAKTLGGRSFRNLTSRITMSAPLIYPSHSRFIQTTPTYNDEAQFKNIIKEKKAANMLTRDVGVRSKLPDHLSSTTPAAPSPQLGENSPMSNAAARAPNSTPRLKSEEDKGEMKETDDGKEETEREEEEEEETRKTEAGEKQQVHHNYDNMWNKCRGGKIGCLSLRSLWMTRKSDKHKSRNKMKKKKKNIFPLPCYNNNNNNNNNSSGC